MQAAAATLNHVIGSDVCRRRSCTSSWGGVRLYWSQLFTLDYHVV